jgi:hypothetical protein
MKTFYCQGRLVDERQLQWLQGWIQEHGDWSRKRLAQELCVCWEWRNARGRLKDFAARSFLLKLHARGRIELPVLRRQMRRRRPVVQALSCWEEPAVMESSLGALQPVQVLTVVPGSDAAKRWAFYLERYHYLGLRVVGENVGYLVCDRQGRDVACLLFGAPAWRCQVRDRFLNWHPAEHSARLCRMANNTRFLILPWVRVPHLASHALGRTVRRINADWQAKYGHGLDWLETFVDTQRYRGVCYRAANWRAVGHSTGRSRQDREHRLQVSRKAVYLYDLHR